MADAAYDAVVIGGGHHGTVIGCYLQNAGLETAIFERQHELGGGASGEECTLPGFVTNPCAQGVRFYGHPAYTDFKLWDHGLQHIFPETGSGVVFDDETGMAGYSAWKVVEPTTGQAQFCSENAEKTIRAIARFSARDAETTQNLLERYRRKWMDAYRETMYNAPTTWGVKDAMERLFDDPEYGMDPVYQFMPIAQVAYDLFESDEMRAYFMRGMMTSADFFPADIAPVFFIIHGLSLILSWAPASIIIGGTHAVTHALQKAFSTMGGQFFVDSEVDKIIIENDLARGIRLVDGTEIAARKLIVADVDVNQLIFRFIGEEHVSPEIAKRVRNINRDRGQVLWAHIGFHELPKYKAAEFDPACQATPRLYVMPKDPEYMVERHMREAYNRGFAQKLALWTVPDSIWDRSRAADGKHIIAVEEFTAPLRYFSEKEWLQIKKDFIGELMRQWQWYAPNMTPDNVIGYYVATPYDVVRRNINMREGSICSHACLPYQWGRFKPIPELSGYKAPIENIYLCSAELHPGVGIGRGSSYICYKIIAQDFGLPRIWEEKGRPY